MSEPYLTPEDLTTWLATMDNIAQSSTDKRFAELNAECAATLRAYAKVVDALGSREDWPDQGDGKCYFCNAAVWDKPEPKHDEWCAWSLARKLMGHAGQG